jgi:hypothetical protein
MAIPSRKQTYGYTDCLDLIEKLDREIDRYDAVVGKRGADENEWMNISFTLIDSAFNATVTAEQLADWVFNDMKPEHRDALGFKEVSDLQKYAREKCRALYLIRHAATASKHWTVSIHPDPTIDTFVTNEDGGWNAYFMDGAEKKPAYVVFCAAREFWTDFIYENKIAFDQFDEQTLNIIRELEQGDGDVPSTR